MNYASLAATARKLISSAGKPVTLVKSVPGTFDPVTGLETGASTSSFLGAGVETEFEYGTTDQALTLGASKRLLCVNIPAQTPMVDRLTVGGVNYLVVKSSPLEPGAVTLLYDVWVK